MKKTFLVWIVIAALVPVFFVRFQRTAGKSSTHTQLPRVESTESPRVVQITNYVTLEKETLIAKKESPAEILAALKAIQSARGVDGRRVIFLLEKLASCGPEGLPVIREFLQSFDEVQFDLIKGKSARDVNAMMDSLLPISLRVGLFDVVRQIGGTEAEAVLVEALMSTGRGLEVAYLGRLLEQMARGNYRSQILAATHELLANPKGIGSKDPLDQNELDYLYGTLRFFNDESFVTQAQTQVIRPDGKIDKNAVTYLEQALQGNALALAKQLYNDPRVTDPASKEPLARVALKYVGASPEADQFYQQTINDKGLTKDARSNLIEDLNEDGLNYKNLSPADLPVIEKRLAFIEANAPKAIDEVNAAAFKEAYKDLLKMREKAARAEVKLQ